MLRAGDKVAVELLDEVRASPLAPKASFTEH
jgi:hypothetical protein